MTCTLGNRASGDSLPTLEITVVGITLLLRLRTEDGTLSYTSRNDGGLRFFLKDIAASAVTVSRLTKRMCVEARYEREGHDDYYIDIDTPLMIGFECISVYLHFKPRRTSPYPVTVEISLMGSDWITIDTTQEHLGKFGLKLAQMAERHKDLEIQRYEKAERDSSLQGSRLACDDVAEDVADNVEAPAIGLPPGSGGRAE